MNKVFSAAQRKDKDIFTGRYVGSAQERSGFSHSPKSRWPLAVACSILLAIVVLAVVLL